MQDTSCLVLPIPAHAFFKQAVLQGEIGPALLQGGGLTTKVLHLAGRRGAGRVARQPALAGLQELLRPAVIHRGGDTFASAKLRDVLLAAQPFQHDADLLFSLLLPAAICSNFPRPFFCRPFFRPRFPVHIPSLFSRLSTTPPLLQLPTLSPPPSTLHL